VAAFRHHEQAAIGELALELPGLPDRNERIAIAAHDHRRDVDGVELRRGHERLSRDVGGDRRQERTPRSDALTLIVAATEERRPGRIVPVGSDRIHEPPGDGCPRFACRRDPGDDECPQPVAEAGRVLERRHRSHREAEQVERF
jgi:hypothetical protein